MKHNAHVVAFKRAVVKGELSKAALALHKWTVQSKARRGQ